MKITVIDRAHRLNDDSVQALDDRLRFGLAGRIKEVERIVLLVSETVERHSELGRMRFSAALRNRSEVNFEIPLDAQEAGFCFAIDRLCRAVIRALDRALPPPPQTSESSPLFT